MRFSACSSLVLLDATTLQDRDSVADTGASPPARQPSPRPEHITRSPLDELPSVPRTTHPQEDTTLFKRIWRGYRPYLEKLAINFLVTLTFWFALYIFDRVAQVFAVKGWPATLITRIHETSILIGFAVFTLFSANDVYQIHKKANP